MTEDDAKELAERRELERWRTVEEMEPPPEEELEVFQHFLDDRGQGEIRGAAVGFYDREDGQWRSDVKDFPGWIVPGVTHWRFKAKNPDTEPGA